MIEIKEQTATLLDELVGCQRRVGYAKGTLRTAIRLIDLGGDLDVIKGSLRRALRVLETGKEEAFLP